MSLDLNAVQQMVNDFLTKFERQPTMDEACNILGLTGDAKAAFLKNMEANVTPGWKLAKTGVQCECGHTAVFTMQKRTYKQDGLGYDGFRFSCNACGAQIEKPFRAPNLDKVEFEPYIVDYKTQTKTVEINHAV